MSFFQALVEFEFLRLALLAGLCAAVGCGIVGSYVQVKQLGYLAGGVAHAALGGMGVAWFLGAAPLWGALVAAVLAALLIGVIRLYGRAAEDMLVSAVWAGGMALGVLFLSLTPGYKVDLTAYLFGNILLVSEQDLLLMVALNVVLIAVALVCQRLLLALCFDEEHARSRGAPVRAAYLLLMIMIAMTVVLLVRQVGLILVIALLTLPAATARHWVATLARMMWVSGALAAIACSGGLMLAWQPGLPPGAVIILLTVALYLLSLGLRAALRRTR